MKALLAVVAGLGLLLMALGFGLRSDSFYAGDPGVKLVAAREALAHPLRPLEVDLPVIGSAFVPFVPPFYRLHGDHAHAITSPLLPVLTAPLLGVFGIRGVYLLPALGCLIAAAACGAMATMLDPRRRGWTTAVIAVLATPFLFYGLEYWEHSLAVAAGALALLALLGGRAFAAGIALGVAVLLRPEALWFGVALVIAWPLQSRTLGARQWVMALAGAVLIIAPLAIYTVGHFGTIVPLHIGSNVGDLDQAWLPLRRQLITLWMGTSDASFWRVSPVVFVAAVTSALPVQRSGRAFLWTIAVVTVALVWLTGPNDGGAQWGPRYLLLAYVPLSVLAADAVDLEWSQRWRAAALTIVLALALVCGWIQRGAYRQLRGTKITYGRIVDFVGSQVAPGEVLVTDLWWLDQVAAATLAGRQVLYAGDAETGHTVMRRLNEASIPVATVVRSRSESADTSSWADGTCFVEERRQRLSTRDLIAIRLRRECR